MKSLERKDTSRVLNNYTQVSTKYFYPSLPFRNGIVSVVLSDAIVQKYSLGEAFLYLCLAIVTRSFLRIVSFGVCVQGISNFGQSLIGSDQPLMRYEYHGLSRLQSGKLALTIRAACEVEQFFEDSRIWTI